MPVVPFQNIADTLDQATATFQGEPIDTETHELTDKQMRNRTIIRVVVVVVILGAIAYGIGLFNRKKK